LGIDLIVPSELVFEWARGTEREEDTEIGPGLEIELVVETPEADMSILGLEIVLGEDIEPCSGRKEAQNTVWDTELCSDRKFEQDIALGIGVRHMEQAFAMLFEPRCYAPGDIYERSRSRISRVLSS
jgi:hypothetical protein